MSSSKIVRFDTDDGTTHIAGFIHPKIMGVAGEFSHRVSVVYREGTAQ